MVKKPLLLGLLLALSPLTASEKDFYEFGLHLLDAGDTYRAVTEFERSLFLAPNGPRAGKAAWNIAAAYYRGRRWQTALESFTRFESLSADAEQRSLAAFYRAMAEYELGDIDGSRRLLEAWLSSAKPSKDKSALAYFKLAEADFVLGKQPEAVSRLRQASALEELKSYHDQFRSAADMIENPPKAGHLSPAALGLASAVVPGSGQAMAGFPWHGLTSLAMVGGFAAWALAASSQGQHELAWTLGGIGAVFHFGNIQGGINAARRSNRMKEQDAENRLLETLRQIDPATPAYLK